MRLIAALIYLSGTTQQLYAQNNYLTTPKDCNSAATPSSDCEMGRVGTKKSKGLRSKKKNTEKKTKKSGPNTQAPKGKPPSTPSTDGLPQRADDKF